MFWMKILKQNIEEFPYNYGYRSRIRIDATVNQTGHKEAHKGDLMLKKWQ
jgi:hypothetical protein